MNRVAHPAAEIWPPARIEVVTARLSLRLPTDEELYALADLAARGVHDPEAMPFSAPWSDEAPADLARGFMAWHWTARGSFEPDRWTLELGVFLGDEPVGCQSLICRHFALRRVVSTGSWLGRAHQGRGIGTEMRHAALALAFDGLGATLAETEAFNDNAASARVSAKVGYQPCGAETLRRTRGPQAPGGRREEVAESTRYRITPAMWEPRRPADIEVRGVDDDVLRVVGIGRGM